MHRALGASRLRYNESCCPEMCRGGLLGITGRHDTHTGDRPVSAALTNWSNVYARALLWLRGRRRAHAAVLIAGALLLVLSLWGVYRAYTLRDAYHRSLVHIVVLEGYADRDPASWTREDIDDIQRRLIDLDHQVARIDDATALPLVGPLVERMPWIGPRYAAGRTMVALASNLTHAGVLAASVGRDTLTAFDASGARATSPATSPTWLDVVIAREAEIRTALALVQRAQIARQQIDERYLPEGARVRMDRLDRLLARYDYAALADQYFPLARTMLGAEGEVRYLVLFQNPAELRPSGGFPGTMGIVTVTDGRIGDYDIFDAHMLSDDYISGNHPPRQQPWAIQEFFPSASLILHDATWWADFPRSGQTIYEMYQETDWPPIDGVVAVQPTVVSAFLAITGPVTVAVNGEERVITAENVYEEIERQRRLHREGVVVGERHKEILALIGDELIERFESADRSTLIRAARALKQAAEIRDIQVYMADPTAQAWLDQRGWTGRIEQRSDNPSLTIVLANVVTNKASLRLIPKAELTLGAIDQGMRQATLEMWLTNTGTNEEDPFYAGFSRWWVEIWLPANSTWEGSHPEPMGDPEAPDGGSYLIAIFPQETGYLSVTFQMPEVDALQLRRQPGVVPLSFGVQDPACGARFETTVVRDVSVPTGALCGT